MKGRSYYEINMLFANRVPARKFKETEVTSEDEEQLRQAHGLAPH